MAEKKEIRIKIVELRSYDFEGDFEKVRPMFCDIKAWFKEYNPESKVKIDDCHRFEIDVWREHEASDEFTFYGYRWETDEEERQRINQITNEIELAKIRYQQAKIEEERNERLEYDRLKKKYEK